MEIQYLLPHAPIPWTPPRKGRNGFYSIRSEQKKQDIIYIKAQKVVELVGPLRLDCVFYMPIPASTHKGFKAQYEKERTWHVKKPDIDNMRKYLGDVLQEAGVYKNDSQICCGWTAKVYSDYPRTYVILHEIDQICGEHPKICTSSVFL